MSCPFDLPHYGELLDAARSGGYRFAFFDRAPEPGDVLLRHDVDMSLEAALTMAELEAEDGVASTYFLMTQSDFYNLDSRAGRVAVARLRELGHRIGLHAIHPERALDGRFDPVFAWHTPDPDYMTEPVEGLVNVMQPGFFEPERYRSDSNRHWRSGCPHDELAQGSFEWLQLLVHPEIWVYPGGTMREKMASMLEAEQELRWRQLAENRIDLS
ncbi:MAG TPA: hypothetical protein VH416_05345 [Gaiellaceae bacterium]